MSFSRPFQDLSVLTALGRSNHNRGWKAQRASVGRILTSKLCRSEMLLCLRPATVSTLVIQLWHDTTEARSGESQVKWQAMRAAV